MQTNFPADLKFWLAVYVASVYHVLSRLKKSGQWIWTKKSNEKEQPKKVVSLLKPNR